MPPAHRKVNSMASFKLNSAIVKGCPAPEKLGEMLQSYGVPDDDEFGVLEHAVAPAAVTATIVRRTCQLVQKMDAKTREIKTERVEKVTLFPFCIKPATETLEVYTGSKTAIEQVGLFASSCLALPVLVECQELDVIQAIETLQAQMSSFQLRAVKISDYSHNSYMTGGYGPKFLDNEHGREFLEKYAAALVSATVRFRVNGRKVNVTLRPNACLSYSCDSDDQAAVQAILRNLIQ